MPLPNGVSPLGKIAPTCPTAGWMGNRGLLHDDNQRIVREWGTRVWITCRLSFKDRTRKPLMRPKRYTELFFLDEATALAAGHRPCGMCRHADLMKFKELWLRGNELLTSGSVTTLDRELHKDRTSVRTGPEWSRKLGDLPSGVIVLLRDGPHLWNGGHLLPWSETGYGPSVKSRDQDEIVVLATPPSIVRAIEAGYDVQWHGSGDNPAN